MAKGSGFEREFCKDLSLWWTFGKRDDVFWRTSQSGGRATQRSKRGKDTKQQYGDVMASDSVGEPLIDLITFELKRGYSHTTVHDLLDRTETNAIGGYEKWLCKARKDQHEAGSFSWVLVHRRDRRQALVLMPRDLWLELRQSSDVQIEITVSCRQKDSMVLENFDLIGMPLEAFLSVHPSHFLELAEVC